MFSHIEDTGCLPLLGMFLVNPAFNSSITQTLGTSDPWAIPLSTSSPSADCDRYTQHFYGLFLVNLMLRSLRHRNIMEEYSPFLNVGT